MTPSRTGLLCEPNSNFKYVSAHDTAKHGVLARAKNEQTPQAAQRGFFNDHSDLYPMPAHIAGLWTHRSRDGKGLEA